MRKAVRGAEKPLIRLAAMPGRLRMTLLACGAAIALVGCGSGDDGTIPQGEADNLVRLLDAIESDVAAGNCEIAEGHSAEFATAVNALSGDVDEKVVQGLTQGADRLIDLSREPGQCDEVTGASGPRTTEEPTTTTTPTVEEPDTTGTEEPDTTTTEETEEPPPEDEGDSEGEEGPLEPPVGEAPGQGDGGRGSPTESGGLEGGKE